MTSEETPHDGEPVVRRGRGRPRKSSVAIERRRGQIVEAAYEVFAEKGYHAAGIADIAARLEIGHGRFYRYFENKRDILDHVVDYGVDKILAVLSSTTLEEASSREELRARLRETGNRLFAEVIDEDPRLPRMILLEVSAIDEELLQRVLGLLETAGALIEPVLANGVRRGFLRADLDVESAARAVVGCTVAGLFSAARGQISEQARNVYIDTVVSMICDNTAPDTVVHPAGRSAKK
jgi:AcrR family transcriptional regulator